MSHKLLSVIWGYGDSGAKFSGAIAAVGLVLTSWLGGWDMTLKLVIIAMSIDVITGLAVGYLEKKLNSRTMFVGGINKFVVLIFIAFSVQMDLMLGNAQPIIRTATIFFYTGREFLSIIENCGKLGIPLPPKLVSVLEQVTNYRKDDDK